MKTNFTIICKVLLTTLLIYGFTSVKAQQTCTAPSMTWNNPVLISGTALQVNAVYKFPSVTPGVYALVTITGMVNGATLGTIDDNVNNGYPAAFQPVINTPSAQVASDSYVSFKIEFKDSIDNKNHKYNCFRLSFIDIDGDDSTIKEFVATKDFDSYAVSSTTSLTMSQVSGGFTQATGSYLGLPGIDTSAYNSNINFNFKDKDKVNELRLGSRVNASHNIQGRFNCGYFAPITMPLQQVTTLPVYYLSFDAVVNNNTVLLKWVTAQEINNSHFEVERSFDMSNYSTAGLVLDGFPANGTGKSYMFKDNAAQLQGQSIVYYRLKQIDIDGKVTYSKVIAVRLQAKTDVAMEVSPNPFIENMNVRFSSNESGTAQIRILNVTGQTMLSKQSIISRGYNSIQVDGLKGLATGMYVAQLLMNGAVIDNQKVIKN